MCTIEPPSYLFRYCDQSISAFSKFHGFRQRCCHLTVGKQSAEKRPVTRSFNFDLRSFSFGERTSKPCCASCKDVKRTSKLGNFFELILQSTPRNKLLSSDAPGARPTRRLFRTRFRCPQKVPPPTTHGETGFAVL